MLQLSLLQYAFALGVLAYASICDLKTREVSNWVWVLAYPTGFALTLVAVATAALNVETVILSVGISLVLGFVLLYFGFYGGADAKALIFVALTFPAYPTAFKALLGDAALPPVLTMFCNSLLLSLIYPLSIFTLNVRDFLRGKKMFEGINVTLREKVLLLFTARKIGLDRLEKSLDYFPSETVVMQDGKLTRKLLHFIKAETDLSPYITNLKENPELFKKGMLATPTIPFIIFFAIALALIPLGNRNLWIISSRLIIA
jgi:Flp pilus assembly protein protease CpaA